MEMALWRNTARLWGPKSICIEAKSTYLPKDYWTLLDMHKLSSYFILLLALANFCAGSPIGKREGRFWGYDIDVSDYSDDYGSKKDYLRIITPNDGTTWDADSYQSVTWSYDGSCT